MATLTRAFSALPVRLFLALFRALFPVALPDRMSPALVQFTPRHPGVTLLHGYLSATVFRTRFRKRIRHLKTLRFVNLSTRPFRQGLRLCQTRVDTYFSRDGMTSSPRDLNLVAPLNLLDLLYRNWDVFANLLGNLVTAAFLVTFAKWIADLKTLSDVLLHADLFRNFDGDLFAIIFAHLSLYILTI